MPDLADQSLPTLNSLLATPAYQAFCRVELAQPYEPTRAGSPMTCIPATNR